MAAFPASSRQGINYEVKEFRLPLGVKISEFLLRDYWTRRLSGEILRGWRGDETRLNALLEWTREHIRRIPPGWPLVDDHILHIIIRGYGEEEQMADVFTCLSSYAGIPAFWGVVKQDPEEGNRLILSFCRVGGRWTVWDVSRGIAFRRKDGSLASVSELATDPDLQEPPYTEYLSNGLPHFFAPAFTRSQKQMPAPRLFFEVKRLCLRLWSRGKEREFDPEIIFGS